MGKEGRKREGSEGKREGTEGNWRQGGEMGKFRGKLTPLTFI